MNAHTTAKNFPLELIAKSAVFGLVIFMLFLFAGTSQAAFIETPECVFAPQEGRIIVQFNDERILDADSGSYSHQTSHVNTSIPVGDYKVSLFSFDGYTGRSGGVQGYEQWYVQFFDGAQLIAESDSISDLPDPNDQDWAELQEEVNGENNPVVLSSDVDSIVGFHTWYLENKPDANSIVPVCAAFDRLPEPPPAEPATIVAQKIVCDDESYLPNWGAGGEDITAETASDFVAASNGHCAFEEGWNFQWAYEGISNPGDEIGEASGNWHTFGPTNGSGIASVDIDDLEGAAYVWVREVFQNGYVPFSFTESNKTGDDYSAELYCSTDVLNYDNYDSIDNITLGNTYYCVAFNALIEPEPPECSDGIDNDGDELVDYPDDLGCDSGDDDDENTKPEITVVGNNPLIIFLNNIFSDPGATANDPEDGDITGDIVVGGDTVDTAVIGTSTITYNVEDSEGLAADEKTRTVVVKPLPPEPPECSDEIDNDGDGLIDYPDDLGCDSGDDDDENTKPVIILIGNNPATVILGNEFTDPGATAEDAEDGDITADIVVGGDTIASTTPVGTYTITYNVEDSEGLAADEKTRTVTVLETTECSDQADNDGDEAVDSDDAGCHTDGDPDNPDSYDPDDNDENSKPVITLVGANPMEITKGDNFTDPGATANDPEDGDITGDIVVGGSGVDPNTAGTYTITYNVEDSEGLSADEVTRTVNVVTPPPPTPPKCTTNCGGGGGGGGGNPINLKITNEKVAQIGEGTVEVTWDTNLQATSKVLYDVLSHATATMPYSDYALSTTETSVYVTDHGVIISGLKDNVLYYFRPMSFRINEKAGGIELSITLTTTGTPPVVPPAPVCEEYLLDYIKLGEENNPVEVLKLQTFLKDFEGFSNIPTTGFYDQASFDAVSEFQERYREDVLEPWSLPGSTGYVYYTTRKKINEIYCQREFPLNTNQLSEIAEFKTLIESLPQGSVDTSTVGFEGTGTTGGLAAGTEAPVQEAEIPSPTGITITVEPTGAEETAAAILAVGEETLAATTSPTFTGNIAAAFAALKDSFEPTWLIPLALLIFITYLIMKTRVADSDGTRKDTVSGPKGTENDFEELKKQIILLSPKGRDEKNKSGEKKEHSAPDNLPFAPESDNKKDAEAFALVPPRDKKDEKDNSENRK